MNQNEIKFNYTGLCEIKRGKGEKLEFIGSTDDYLNKEVLSLLSTLVKGHSSTWADSLLRKFFTESLLTHLIKTSDFDYKA